MEKATAEDEYDTALPGLAEAVTLLSEVTQRMTPVSPTLDAVLRGDVAMNAATLEIVRQAKRSIAAAPEAKAASTEERLRAARHHYRPVEDGELAEPRQSDS
ncbi:hypothetical protein [Amycolatopsis sp. CA-230715]|uniref:hypothetical protein n=1 Tax=Amycolatopsis sp. CA-230715 TaxID=2745196 RepID=UPI001C03677D|nr:hypothetical protein [Amycolatopsis sp. CA-230715]